jgi:hypothetical protein
MRRVPRQLRREVLGVTLWLNGNYRPEDERGRARVRKILDLLQKLEGELKPGIPMWKLPAASGIEKELAKLTRRYRTWPRFAPETCPTVSIKVAPMWEKSKHSLEERIALEVLFQLVKQGLLRNLTFCETCKTRWVFRSGEKGKYCSVECRQAPYESSTRRKKLKAKRNREYYDRWIKSLRIKRRTK